MSKDKDIFTEEGLKNITGFFHALHKVHCRLMREGYKIKDGKLISPDEAEKE